MRGIERVHRKLPLRLPMLPIVARMGRDYRPGPRSGQSGSPEGQRKFTLLNPYTLLPVKPAPLNPSLHHAFCQEHRMKMLRKKLTAAVLATSASLFPVIASAQANNNAASATVARDVNGFRLGMTVDEARNLAGLEYIGGDQFEASTEGFQYNFGVTPLGRIYRVQSTQSLGRFDVDRSFVRTLKQRLTSKYGPPSSDNGDVFQWQLIEDVAKDDGTTAPVRTMWMSALIGGTASDRTLDITLIDFRILWADQASVNRTPRTAAEERLAF